MTTIADRLKALSDDLYLHGDQHRSELVWSIREDLPPTLDHVHVRALSYLASARLIDVATHFGITTNQAGELIQQADTRLNAALPEYGQPSGTVTVITCDCHCHHPAGYVRGGHQPIPPAMRPCENCADNAH